MRQVDDLGGLLAVVCANARGIEAKRGMLGLLNWSGSKLLTLAHRRLASQHLQDLLNGCIHVPTTSTNTSKLDEGMQ